jgi:hypothetical protein
MGATLCLNPRAEERGKSGPCWRTVVRRTN